MTIGFILLKLFYIGAMACAVTLGVAFAPALYVWIHAPHERYGIAVFATVAALYALAGLGVYLVVGA